MEGGWKEGKEKEKREKRKKRHKSKIKLLAGLVSSESSLIGLHMAAFSLCPHGAFPPCACTPYFSLCLNFLFL